MCAETVIIGANTLVGGGTCIYDTDFHPVSLKDRQQKTPPNTSPVRIGKNVFIGGHCIILKGVTIGEGSVVGAGSVVTSEIPENEVWAGNPAKLY